MLGTLEGFRQYADDRGLIAPGLRVDVLATQALRRATDYIEANYVARFMAPFTETAENVLPAVYEAAILEVETPGFWSRTWTPGDRKVLTEVQGIKWTVIDDKGRDPVPTSSRIEGLLRAYVRGTGPVVLVV